MPIAKPLRRRLVLFALVVLCAACAAPEKDRPNILLISIDTLRADHLGCYGRTSAQTPNIDALAAGGVVFETAVSPVPITLPSHATMLTGQIPPHHGVRLNTESRLLSSVTTLPELLLARGYRTGAFIAASPLDSEGGLDQGFEVYDDVTRLPGVRPERSAEEVFDAARVWLSGPGDPETPVFAFIHLFDPHWPLENALPGDGEPSYDGEIAYVDRQLGAFLSALPDTPRWRDALTVIVSDHGEGLGEHGETSHGLLVYESTLRVPWILHRPSAIEPLRIEEPVGLVDLAPTLAALAGVEPLAEVDGVSLVPVLDGSASTVEREFYFESLYGYLELGWARLRGVRSGPLKYTSAPKPELFDLHADPDENVNLVASHAEDAARFERRLQTFGDGAWTRTDTDAEQRARLASLGYVSARPVVSDDATRPDPKDKVDVFYRLAEAIALTDSNRHAEAYPAFEALDGEFEQSPHFYTEYGDAAAGLGRWEDARRLYARVLELDVDNLKALENLAVAQLALQAFDDAHGNASRLLTLDPDHVDAHYLVGSVEIWARRELGSGARHWRRLLELDPGHQKAGQIRRMLAAYDAGERDLTALRRSFVGAMR